MCYYASFPLFLILSCQWGCATQHLALKPAPPVGQAPEVPTPPPPITDEQILGLQSPPDMIEDPESGQYAIAQVMQSFWKLRAKPPRTAGIFSISFPATGPSSTK